MWVLLVDYSIKDNKNIPLHLFCFTTCGFFLSQRGYMAWMNFACLAPPQNTHTHILFDIYLNIYKYNLIISIQILLIIYLFYTYFIIILKKKKIVSYFLELLCLPFSFIFYVYLINLTRISKIFSTHPNFALCRFFPLQRGDKAGDGAPIIWSRPFLPHFYVEMLGQIFLL